MKPRLSLWAQEDFRDKFSNGQITWHSIALASNNDARNLRVIFDQDQDLSNSHVRSISHVRIINQSECFLVTSLLSLLPDWSSATSDRFTEELKKKSMNFVG